MTGEPSEDPRDAANVTQGIGIDPQRRDRELAKPARDGGVLAGVVENDEIGPAGNHGLDVRPDAVAQIGHGFGGGRIVTVGRAAHHGGIRPDGEQKLGGSGDERNDPAGRCGEVDRVTRIVDDAYGAVGHGGGTASPACQRRRQKEPREGCSEPSPMQPGAEHGLAHLLNSEDQVTPRAEP